MTTLQSSMATEAHVLNMDPSAKKNRDFETPHALMFSFTYHIDGSVLEKSNGSRESRDKSRSSQLLTYIRLLAYNYFNYLYHGIFPTKHTS